MFTTHTYDNTMTPRMAADDDDGELMDTDDDADMTEEDSDKDDFEIEDDEEDEA